MCAAPEVSAKEIEDLHQEHSRLWRSIARTPDHLRLAVDARVFEPAAIAAAIETMELVVTNLEVALFRIRTYEEGVRPRDEGRSAMLQRMHANLAVVEAGHVRELLREANVTLLRWRSQARRLPPLTPRAE